MSDPGGGKVPAYDHPSAGQVLSALGNAVAVGTGSVLGLAGNIATSDQYGRTLLGRAIDDLTGGTPELPDRWEAPREKYNIDARGEQQLAPRGTAPSATEDPLSTGDTGAAPSDVMLQDRRRPYGLYAGTTLLARRA
ncbi:MAG TPA: hypothetical protein VMT54_04760 [Candidatus Cybelea sp.]|nr:hypothetical protein [Candidatus Cybelea sp.]